MATILIGLDAVLCLVIVLAALDYLRAVYFLEQPMLCFAFYLVAIGAFGLLAGLIAGAVPSIWSVLLHIGVTAYAAAHYRDIFVSAWHWDGSDRRKVGP